MNNTHFKQNFFRIIQIIIGIILFICLIPCFIGILSLFGKTSEYSGNDLFLFISCVVAMIVCCIWVIYLVCRLIFNIPSRSSYYFGPIALHLFSAIFFLLPVTGFFTGFYEQKGLIAVVQAMVYIGIGIRLHKLARSRSNQLSLPYEQDKKD